MWGSSKEVLQTGDREEQRGFTDHCMGFPWTVENLENKNDHRNVMDHDKLVKSHGICYQSWNFTNFAPELYQVFNHHFCIKFRCRV